MRKVGLLLNHSPILVISIVILITITSGCFKNPDELINPEYEVQIIDVESSNTSLYGEKILNLSYHYLVLEIQIQNKNSDYELFLGASRFWISTDNEIEYNYSSESDGFVTIDPKESHQFYIDFLIPTNERGEYLIVDLTIKENDTKKVEIPSY